jgi:hypothetical protein
MISNMKTAQSAWRGQGVRILAGIALILVLALARFGMVFHS